EHANLVPALPGTKVGAWHSCVDSQGEVWVIDADDQLFVIKNGQTSLIHSWKGSTNLFCGREKRVYVFDQSGISVVRGRRIRHLPLLPGFTGYGDHYLFLGLLEQPGADMIAAIGGLPVTDSGSTAQEGGHGFLPIWRCRRFA